LLGHDKRLISHALTIERQRKKTDDYCGGECGGAIRGKREDGKAAGFGAWVGFAVARAPTRRAAGCASFFLRNGCGFECGTAGASLRSE
jgi:hypothetical protein